MRSFIAIDLPKRIKERIRSIQRDFDFLRDKKFVNPEQAHITLKFLGEVEEEKIEHIRREISGIETEPFVINLRGVGFFPESLRTIRVIWIGLRRDDGFDALSSLHQEIENRMKSLGFPEEKNKFSPHITICRVKMVDKEQIKKAVKKYNELSDIEVGSVHVEEVKLKKSNLTPEGPIYEDIYVKKF